MKKTNTTTAQTTQTQKASAHRRIYFSIIVIALFLLTNLISVGFAKAQSSGTSNKTDTVEPSDVENVKATAGDSEATLTWDSATDNTGVVGYKIYRGTHSVTKTEDRYDLPTIPVGDVQSYTVKNLTNEQDYYFVVTAMDAAGNESVNYSFPEATATPQAGLHSASVEDDGKSPQVKNVTAPDNITVLVEFSEPIKLPLDHPTSAFQIEKISDKSRLQVQSVQISADDTSGKTVALTTAPQKDGEQYVLTAGIEVQDFYNNPVESGTSDTGSFKGSSKNKQVASTNTTTTTTTTSADTTPPTITDAVADYNNRISVSFSEKVVLPADPTKKFVIAKKATSAPLRVVNASLSVDGQTIYLITDAQEGVEYDIQMFGVKDEAGNLIASDSAKVTVTGNTSGIKDTTPPEDVTGLAARIKDKQKNIVELTWKASKNTANDLNEQLLYQSEGKYTGTYGAASALGKDPTSTDVEGLQGGKWYTFKVTTKDTSGNESKGAITSIYITKTGPGMVAAGLTSLVMGLYSRKKKKKN